MFSMIDDKLNGLYIRTAAAIRNKVAESNSMGTAFGVVIAIVVGLIVLGAMVYVINTAMNGAAAKVDGIFDASVPTWAPTPTT